MNTTIIDFPQVGLLEGEKIAKLSTVKRDTLKAKYQSNLSTIRNVQETSYASMPKSEPVSVDYNALLNKMGVEVVRESASAFNSGARKLKINPIVKEKSLTCFKATRKDVPQEVSMPIVDEVKEPVVDTRMSRLERTVEIPLVEPTQTLKREDVRQEPVNNIINTPSRFERHVDTTPYDSIINDTPVVKTPPVQEVKKEVETRGGDPNLYNRLIHGSEVSSVSKKLADARSKLSTANEEKEKARAVNANLEAEVANVRATIEKLKRQKDEKEQRELDNTLNMLQTTKEEILSETRKYDNLQEELAELMRQRDALLSTNSEDMYRRSI